MRRELNYVVLVLLLAGCSDDPPTLDASQPVDAAADASGDLAKPDTSQPDRGPDSFVPFSLSLTVNKIPITMNGSAAYTALDGKSTSYRLTVPTHGFTLDVAWAGTEAVASSLELSADRPMGVGGGLYPAGTDIAGKLVKAKGGKASLLVPQSLALAPGKVTFTATILEGAVKRTATITVDVAKKTFLLDPFRLEDTWVLVFSRDVAAISGGLDAKGVWTVTCKMGKNGVTDLEEDLRVLGLSTAKMRADCAKIKGHDATGTNAIMRAWLEGLVVAATRKAYGVKADGSHTADSVRIRILHELDPKAPDLSTYSYQKLTGGETKKNFSAISVGGGDLTKSFLGRSKTVDLRNVQSEDNLSPSYGVLTTNALAYLTWQSQNQTGTAILRSDKPLRKAGRQERQEECPGMRRNHRCPKRMWRRKRSAFPEIQAAAFPGIYYSEMTRLTSILGLAKLRMRPCLWPTARR